MKRFVANLATAAALGIIAAVSIDAQSRPVVNANTASLEQLQFLPHVGVATAGQIVTFRAAHGQFHRLSDLYAVPHLGVKSVARFSAYVVFEGPTTATTKIHVGGAK